jgi:hypothetical protein
MYFIDCFSGGGPVSLFWPAVSLMNQISLIWFF